MGRLERARDRMRRLEGVWGSKERQITLRGGSTITYQLPKDALDAMEAWMDGEPHFLLTVLWDVAEESSDDPVIRLLQAMDAPPPGEEASS